MPFNQIGRLTLKPVEQESIDVTVEPFSPGNFSFFCSFLVFLFWDFKLNIFFPFYTLTLVSKSYVPFFTCFWCCTHFIFWILLGFKENFDLLFKVGSLMSSRWSLYFVSVCSVFVVCFFYKSGNVSSAWNNISGA
jgi:hypothetical protein